MYNKLRAFSKNLAKDIPEEEIELICSYFKPMTALKEKILVSENEIASQMYFINEGCLRAYYIQENGNEATRYISFEGGFATSFSSFISQRPATDNLQAVKKSQLLRISRADFYHLADNNIYFQKIYRRALEIGMVHNIWRLETLLSMDAKSRYEDLIKAQSHIVQKLPNKIVASYLGISQETLSRLKGKSK